MTDLPRDPWPDATLPILRDPYRYVSRRAAELGSDGFETRLIGRPATCLTGPEAAKFFYAQGNFSRRGAIPGRIASVIFGNGVVQSMDGEAHRHRKAMHLGLMDEAGLARMDEIAAREWEARLPRWREAGGMGLYPEMRLLLTRAACDWAGVSLERGEESWAEPLLTDLFSDAGAVGLKHQTGLNARARAREWMGGHIAAIRAAEPEGRGEEETVALRRIALWRDLDGAFLPQDAAADELLSETRPIVAAALYIAHLGHALHAHPGHRQAVAEDEAAAHDFAQEVRRLYPFFPMLAGIAAKDLDWRGARIPQGRRVILDIYGTNRDARAWADPDAFRPDRFRGWPGDPFTMIPQGGGDHAKGHRCPGEWMTIRLMAAFARRLAALGWEMRGAPEGPDMRALPADYPGGLRLAPG